MSAMHEDLEMHEDFGMYEDLKMCEELERKMIIIDPDEEGSTFSFFMGPKGLMEFAAEERRVRTDLVIKMTGRKINNETWILPLESAPWGNNLTLLFGCA